MRRFSNPRQILIFAVTGAILAACGSTSNNPNAFNVDINGGKMTGQYNSTGFTEEEVKGLLAVNCSGGKLASFGAQPVGANMVAFTATCQTA